VTTSVRLAGFATRSIALALDGALLNAIAVLLLGGLWLAGSVVGIHIDLRNIVAGAVMVAAWLILLGIYLVGFWTLTGQTPGMRCMGIRLVSRAGGHVRMRAAVVRLAGMWLAALPAGAGFLLILVDDRRRGLHDRLARTLVVHLPRRVAGGAAAPVPAALEDARAHTTTVGTTTGAPGHARTSLS
jgi:uncharacterized RDD family membrane protein YckC